MAKVSGLKLLCGGSLLLNSVLILLIVNLFKFDSTRADLFDYLVNHFGNVEIVIAGDSLTRRNSDLAWQTAGLALNVQNVAVDGNNIYEIAAQVDNALKWNPKLVTIMAGTNRVKDMSAVQTFVHYQKILTRVLSQGGTPIIMAAPLTDRPPLNDYLVALNVLLFQFALENGLPFFDTNEAIGVEQKLGAPYTVDGVHLTPLAYERLNKKLIPFIQSHLQSVNNNN